MFDTFSGPRNVVTRCAVRSRDDRGMVTAELALALPLLIGITVILAGVLMWLALALTTHDVAHHAVRAAARGTSESDVRAYVREAIPGADVTWTASDSSITIGVTRSMRPLGQWFPEWQMRIERTALWELSAWNFGDGGW